MTEKMVPKEYDHKREKYWQDRWEDTKIHKFIGDGVKPRYVIDTPPPYPTGSIHLGHVLNWTYIDMTARYKRLRGYDVLFPQGWDCHGLPTEVKVEETHNIKKNNVPRSQFRRMCVDLTKENIGLMRKQMQAIGFSQDWSREFITMTPEYMRKTQYSFLKMYENGLIYQGIHPVNWCTRCETAIAFAEVEYESNETNLNYVRFKGLIKDGNSLDGVLIATTRPELMSACVGVVVNPEDERYSDLVGKKVEVPLSGQKVKVIADDEVDPKFGTGAVMVCTFGDKTDVSWINKHNLDTIEIINEKGRMSEAAGKYKDMSLNECKLNTINDLKKNNCIEKQEKISQNVGQCWRCKTPIEILVKKQWFIDVNKLNDDVKQTAEEINWIPKYMKSRLLNWADSMQWDWCISRQRIFATPIPVWFCEKCGRVHVAIEDELPVDPTQSNPIAIDKNGEKINYICECGSTSFRGEEDVLDTWMDSSISPLWNAGWPNLNYTNCFPADLRPQGHDIIRTWAFYTILRTKSLTGIKPFKNIEVNGMVFGEDGYKMSKSRDNVISPDEVIDKYGADSLRIWAANSSPGSDLLFEWKDIKYGYKFLRKFWNAFRFISLHINEDIKDKPALKPLDKWILSKLSKLTLKVTNGFEEYNFLDVISSIQRFIWHDFCDEYIETVKHRLYNEKQDEKSIKSKLSAKYTLKTVIDTSLKLLTPITPHFTSEVYSYLVDETDDNKSNAWFKSNNKITDLKWKNEGDIAIELISHIRRFKSSFKIPLNQKLNTVNIYSENNDLLSVLNQFEEDIKGTLKIENLGIKNNKPNIKEKIIEITPRMDKIGPEFKGKSKKISQHLNSTPTDEIAKILDGDGEVDIEGNTITYNHLNIKKELQGESGEKVDLLNLDDLDLIIEITR
ncbi:MAG: valine--tRNA ligase [Methanobrevibacter sp.]|jgi:valyl-tRNA synthetase|nr:valine--tRNA ligase [Candidatus Methanovirga basalitermitum]